MRDRWTRRGFLAAAGAGAWTLAAPRRSLGGRRVASALTDTAGTVQSFRSRPDLTPPTVDVTTAAGGTAPGYVFVAPLSGPGAHGPLILDDAGQVVWFRKVANGIAADFRVQSYRGEPVLTWWEGTVDQSGIGRGVGVIADSSYRELARVRAGNGYDVDVHELLLTDRGTALITVYAPVAGRTDNLVEGIVQEIDVASGRVLFEWHSLDHVGVDETKKDKPTDPSQVWDYFHLNSIDVDPAGNLLLSARHTWAVYSVDRRSGEVAWRLGGTKSDFELGPGAAFGWQHDARSHGGAVSIFDDASGAEDDPQSRGLVLALDLDAMRATLVREFPRPKALLVEAMGSTQLLPDGGAFVGWGTQPLYSEFAPDGTIRYDARFAGGGFSYRAFRDAWTGTPLTKPALNLEQGPGADAATLHVSWNGATEVRAWKVLLGPRPDRLRHLRSVGRIGFETTLTLHGRRGFVAVEALDAEHRVLGTSRTVALPAPA